MRPSSLQAVARFYSRRAHHSLEQLPDGRVTLTASAARSTDRCCLWVGVMQGKALVSCPETTVPQIEKVLGDLEAPGQLRASAIKDRLIAIAAAEKSVETYEGVKLACDDSTFRPAITDRIRKLTVESAPTAIHHLASIGIPDDVGYLLHDSTAYACYVGEDPVSFAATHPCEAEDIGNMMVGTLQDHRRRGYGKASASATTSEVLRQGRTAVWGTEAGNRAAIRAAESLGYECFCWVFEIRVS